MIGNAKSRKEWGTINGVVATLLMLARLVERIAYAPAPLRRFVLWIMLRAETAAYSYVFWTARDYGAPLRHPGPAFARDSSDPEDALELGIWFRAMAMALRDLLRHAPLVRLAQTDLRRVLLNVERFTQRDSPVPQAPDTS